MGIPEKLDQLQVLLINRFQEDPKGLEFFKQLRGDISEHERQLEILSEAGAKLSQEQEQSSALSLILYTARNLTNADAGTVYSVKDEYYDDPYNPGELKSKSLVFEEMHTESKNYFNTKPDMPPVQMEIDGKPNENNVSAYCANTGQIVNIPDAYDEEGFDFSGTKVYDENNNYRSKSMLVLPLRDHENQINGVLQLINRQTSDGEVVRFTKNDQTIVQAMSYQAAISLTTQKLLREHIELFDSFVRVLAEGLGEKSPYTYGHINRVAELSMSLAEKIDGWDTGLYDRIHLTKDQMEELRLAAWMHDIGKLTTPEHVVSKPIKLQLLSDQFEMIIQRFNSKFKDLEIEALQKKIQGMEENQPPEFFRQIEEEKKAEIQELVKDLNILNKSNIGGEFLAENDRKVIEKNSLVTVDQHLKIGFKTILGEERISGVELSREKGKTPLISEEEKNFLTIARGTLSGEERKIINDHAERSWRWLMKLPFPKKKMKLPLYAGAHHETLGGDGYPNRLKANQLPIQSRIIAVADIFEALTANDRPYKTPMKLSKALDILGNMVKGGELDAEVVKIFLKSGLFLKYANDFLDENQIDTVYIDQWLNKYYPKDFSNTLPN
ncbi:MAG: GAF domain-containing protein [Proteobacteria bacterium]|nr:GAF domain-containing protein [Pseudomonadota bacterium]